MTDYPAALAAAREATTQYAREAARLHGPQHLNHYADRMVQANIDLFDAIDAQVPPAWISVHGRRLYLSIHDAVMNGEQMITPLYAAPSAPAVVEPARAGAVPGLHPRTADLVQRFAFALAEKLAAAEVKYGHSDGWAEPDWMDECRAKLIEHVAKGDPRDVAAYAAFLWHHGERTALQAPPSAVPEGWRVMWFTGSFKRGSERWEIYDPNGNGGTVDENDVLDNDVAALLDALAAIDAPPAAAVPADACPACGKNWGEHRFGYSASRCKQKPAAAAPAPPSAVPEGFELNLAVADYSINKLQKLCPVTPPEAACIKAVIVGARAMLAAANKENNNG